MTRGMEDNATPLASPNTCHSTPDITPFSKHGWIQRSAATRGLPSSSGTGGHRGSPLRVDCLPRSAQADTEIRPYTWIAFLVRHGRTQRSAPTPHGPHASLPHQHSCYRCGHPGGQGAAQHGPETQLRDVTLAIRCDASNAAD